VLITHAPRGRHLGSTSATLSQDSRLIARVAAFGGELCRQDIDVHLRASAAKCELEGLYAAGANQQVELRTLISHDASGCTSRERTRGLLGGNARGSFDGRIIVPADAQKSDASQQNANLLLSEGAVVHAHPQLEIFADDVRCSHGAWVGQLDTEAVSYLRSRGIPEPEARAMLTQAFADTVLQDAADPWFQAQARQRLAALLGEGLQGGGR
jgi:Fe-S cluster assembly protein SufD